MMTFMNTANPFQIPVCLQRADTQQRRRERFKRGFIAVVAATVVLLVGLLIEGCMTEKSATAAPTPGQKITVQPTPLVTPTDTFAEQRPEKSSHQAAPATLNVTRQSAAPAASDNTPASSSIKSIYVVKSGDTLIRIAKVHGTTVKALKTANNLSNDRIMVGAKLKIPEA
jgi:LysM repeat protein